MLKPQDVVLALYLSGNPARTQGEMVSQVGLSQPEISNVLRRLQISRLLLQDARTVVVPNLVEFCVHGVKYAYPGEIGRRVGGIPTAALAPPLLGQVLGEEGECVWPSASGRTRAASLAPIHPCAVHAAERDPRLHELLALIDGMRIGKIRMSKLSERYFRERLAPRRAEG